MILLLKNRFVKEEQNQQSISIRYDVVYQHRSEKPRHAKLVKSPTRLNVIQEQKEKGAELIDDASVDGCPYGKSVESLRDISSGKWNSTIGRIKQLAMPHHRHRWRDYVASENQEPSSAPSRTNNANATSIF